MLKGVFRDLLRHQEQLKVQFCYCKTHQQGQGQGLDCRGHKFQLPSPSDTKTFSTIASMTCCRSSSDEETTLASSPAFYLPLSGTSLHNVLWFADIRETKCRFQLSHQEFVTKHQMIARPVLWTSSFRSDSNTAAAARALHEERICLTDGQPLRNPVLVGAFLGNTDLSNRKFQLGQANSRDRSPNPSLLISATYRNQT